MNFYVESYNLEANVNLMISIKDVSRFTESYNEICLSNITRNDSFGCVYSQVRRCVIDIQTHTKISGINTVEVLFSFLVNAGKQ